MPRRSAADHEDQMGTLQAELAQLAKEKAESEARLAALMEKFAAMEEQQQQQQQRDQRTDQP
jgi:uncharacterized coiled-coil protein SlyX